MRKLLHLTSLALLGLTPEALAVPDACDAFGPLAITQPISSAETQIEGTLRFQNLGYSVANIGDFNGDGDEDFALGAPGDNAGGGRAGAVYLFFGPMADEGLLNPSAADVIIVGPGIGAQAGWSVDGVGDLDGDGRDDLVIGGFPQSGVYASTGVAWVVRGAANPPATANLLTGATATIVGPAGSQFGTVVSGIGDIDGDGTPEFAIGAPTAVGTGGAATAGAVFVFNGIVTGAINATAASYGFLGSVATGRLGTSIANVGDLDGDGLDDLGLGAPTEPIPNSLHIRGGAVHVVSGGALSSGVHDVAAVRWAALRGQFTDRAGTSFAAAGDQNDDGIGDLWVGAPQFGAGKRGALYLVYGGTAMVGENFVEDIQAWRARGVDSFDLFGTSVASNVDFDGDGNIDVLVGAERADGPLQAETGAAWAILGPFEEGDDVVVRREFGALYGQREDAYTGADVAVFEDINGDGFGDALVPSWRGDSITVNRTGEVGLFLGGADLVDEVAWYRDADNDTWGDTTNSVVACEPPPGYVGRDGDCNDASSAYRPFALEPDCGSTIDYNCDGSVGQVDADGDGVDACEGDCNDQLANVHVGQPEVCFDELDNDCSGQVDDALAVDATTWYPDIDGDGFGNRALGIRACEQPDIFLTPPVTVGGDCVDVNAAIYPGAAEFCDTIDNNCDDVIDEDEALDAPLWFADVDGDHYGDIHNYRRACQMPDGYTTDTRDCEDQDAAIRPGANEVCDFVDNDCDNRFYRGGISDLTDDNSEGSILGAGNLAEFGSGVGFLPDVDDDGVDDVYVAAPMDGAAANNGGAVYIFPVGFDQQLVEATYADGSHDWTFRVAGNRAGGQLGTAVAGGDFNGDGIGDLAVGAPDMRRPNSNQGAVFIFFGPLAGDKTQEEADVIFSGSKSGERLGNALAADDLDGDGMDDLIIGAPGSDLGGTVSGAAFVVYGRTAWSAGGSIASVQDAVLAGAAEDKLGQIATPLGDLNGDGHDDFAVSSPDWSVSRYGRVWIVYGTEGRFAGNLTATSILTGNQTSERLGNSLANVGDINGDGFSDLVVGGRWNRALIFYGSNLPVPSGPARESANVTIEGTSSQWFAENVAAAGDMNRDGYMDVLLSSHGDDDNGNNAGAVYVLFGKPDLPGFFESDQFESQGRLEEGSEFPTYSYLNRSRGDRLYAEVGNLPFVEGGKMRGVEAESQTGRYVSGGRDINGDGFTDLVLGSPRANGRTGEVRFVFGGGYGLDRELDGASLPWSTALTVDGDDADWNDNVRFDTSSGAPSASAVSWDAEQIYLGSRIVDVRTGGSSHFFVTYLGDGDGTGRTVGVALNGQTPNLPFAADVAVVWRADGASAQVYTTTGASWTAQSFAAAGATVVESNTNEVVEIAVPRSLLAGGTTLDVASAWLFTGAGSESSFAAVPSDSFANGSTDPDYGSYFAFDTTAPDSPTGYGTNGASPTALEATMSTYVWDRDLDRHGDDTMSSITDCAMHIPQKFAEPETLRTDLAQAYAVDGSSDVALRLGVGGTPFPELSGPADDCDDYDWNTYFGAEEDPLDGRDNDCDGYDSPNRLPGGRVSIQRDACEVDLDVEGGAPGYADPDKVRVGDTAVAVLNLRDPDRGSIDETPIDIYYEWYVNGARIDFEENVAITDFGYWEKGDLLEVWVYLDDQRGVTAGPFVGTTIIRNTRPVGTDCAIDPANPVDDDALEASPSGFDADADAITWSYQWYRNGTRMAGETGRRLLASRTREGDQFYVDCKPTDGEDPGLPERSDPVTVEGEGDTGAEGTCPPADIYEENDDIFSSPDITAMASVSGLNLCGPDDDWFSVLVSPETIVTLGVDFVNADGDIDVRLYDDNLMEVDSSTSTDDREEVSWTNDSSVVLLMSEGEPVVRAGTVGGGSSRWVYVQVYHFEDRTPAGTPYDIDVTFTPLSDTADSGGYCADDFYEENDAVWSAYEPVDTTYMTAITCPDDLDFYTMYLEAGQVLNIYGRAWSYDGWWVPFNLTEVTGGGTIVDFGQDVGDGYYGLTILGRGDWVYWSAEGDTSWYGGSAYYEQSFDVQTVDSGDVGVYCDDPLEDNNESWSAYFTSNFFYMEDLAICPGESDWHYTYVDTGERVDVQLCPTGVEGTGDVLIEVYLENDGLSLLETIDDVSYGCESFTLTDNGGDPAYYYYRVVFLDGDGPPVGFTYTLDVQSDGGGGGSDTGDSGDSGDSGAGGGCPLDYLEPNDGQLQAISSGTPTAYYGLTACEADADWFTFTLGDGETVDIQTLFSHAEGDIDMVVYVDVGALVEVGASTTSGDNEWIRLTNNGPGSQTYFVEVYMNAGGDNRVPGSPYDLLIDPVSDTGDTGGSKCLDDGYEDNDFITAATGLPTEILLTDLTLCTDDADYYSFYVPDGQAVDVSLWHDGIPVVDLDLTLYDDAFGYVDGSFNYLDSETVRASGGSTGRTYYLEVRAAELVFKAGSASSQPYNLNLRLAKIVDTGDTGGACDPWSHTLDVDGCDADWYMQEGFATSAGSEALVNVTWDADYLYVGVRHPDIASGGRKTWVMAYFDNQSGNGHNAGFELNNQQPTLPFTAQYALRWRADGGYDELLDARFLPDDTPWWGGQTNYFANGTDGAAAVESNIFGVVEFKVPRAAIRVTDRVNMVVNVVFEGSGVRSFFESSYAVIPNDSFSDGALDPDYGSYYEFDLTACDVTATWHSGGLLH